MKSLEFLEILDAEKPLYLHQATIAHVASFRGCTCTGGVNLKRYQISPSKSSW